MARVSETETVRHTDLLRVHYDPAVVLPCRFVVAIDVARRAKMVSSAVTMNDFVGLRRAGLERCIRRLWVRLGGCYKVDGGVGGDF